jgi:hypothetical protein
MEATRANEMTNLSEIVAEEIKTKHEDIDLIKHKIERAALPVRVLGRTLEEWLDELKIDVRYPSTPHDVMRYCAEFSEKSDKAYRAQARLRHQMKTYLMSYDQRHNQEISKHALNKSRKIMPAAETLREVAKSQMGIRYDILVQYEKDIEFFQSMIYKLNNTLTSIRTLGMSNGTQLKGEMGFQA